MGQYYKPINLDTNEWILAHDCDNGLKLMEHSWIGNTFVGAVMQLLLKGEKWYKSPIVWCGDYYDEEGEEGYYGKVTDETKIIPDLSLEEEKQEKAIIVNHTKKEYVVCSKIPKDSGDGKINPLPLLTALGNGRGGGDYYGEVPDIEKVGIWARDIISVDFEVPKGFTELKVMFKEE